MDFLDPKIQQRHRLILLLGYGLMAIAIGLATLILMYVAYGYGIDKNGQIIQNGGVYFSSSPKGASIYLNGERAKNQTNTRKNLAAGQYTVQMKRPGYNTWQRSITVEGGSEQRFDYAFLFPANPVTSTVQTFRNGVSFASQTPDKKHLLINTPGQPALFSYIDITTPTKAQSINTLTLPENLSTFTGTKKQLWTIVNWSSDNKYALLQYTFDKGHDYILLNVARPNASINLTQTFKLSSTAQISFLGKAHDRFYIYDQKSRALSTTTLNNPIVQTVLTEVAGYKAFGDNIVLYATTAGAKKGEILIKLLQGTDTYVLRSLPVNSAYLLDLTQYDGAWYVACGAPTENKVYVYKNPVSALKDAPTEPLVPVQILKVTAPDYISFSNNARFIMAERGTEFYTYDILNDNGYRYTASQPLDTGQAHATWMDGFRLTYVSGGRLVLFDYDYVNQTSLMPASAQFSPFFSPDYRYVYAVSAGKSGGVLTDTALRTTADL